MKPIRIGIFGAQSTGKTTLLNALRSEKIFKDFVVCNEVTSKVAEFNLPVNEDGSDKTQKLIMMHHCLNLVMNDHLITDRTALDGLVYTQWLNEEGKVSTPMLLQVQDIAKKLLPMYTHLFFIRPEFPIEDNGFRSVNERFRDGIDHLFEEAVKNLPQHTAPVITLTGSVRERVQQVLENVKEIK